MIYLIVSSNVITLAYFNHHLEAVHNYKLFVVDNIAFRDWFRGI